MVQLRVQNCSAAAYTSLAPQKYYTDADLKKPLYAGQTKLAKLPVPKLEDTVARYLRSVQPLASEAEFEQTKKAAEDFVRSGGVGHELQKRLIARAQTEPMSWLIEWWNDRAYFSYRDPIVINVSYFFQFADDKVFRTQTSRAAAITQAALEFRRQMMTRELAPEATKEGPLDMITYEYMFNTARQALPNTDYTKRYSYEDNSHITVMSKNRIFSFPVIDPATKQPLPTAKLERLFKQVLELTSGNKAADREAIGLMTTENRDEAAKLRESLLRAHSSNAEALEHIESSIFTVCLDDTAPVNRNDTGRALWHGDGRNRFFEKSVQFVVFANGKAGMIGEHSIMDGTPTCRLGNFVMESLAAGKIDHGTTNIDDSLPAVREVGFKGLDASFGEALVRAAKRFDKDVADHDHDVLAFTEWGREKIKEFKFSPDAFVQMSIQLAYYRVFGVCRSTYESAQTRKFFGGRTEVVRTVSNESVAWVKAMQDPSATPAQRLKLLRDACNGHVKYMNDAVNGHGCDRHLLGLRLLQNPGENHALFTDPLFARSSRWNLSTSQLSSEFFEGYGWGEVVPDGFGIAYMINKNYLNYNVACLRSWAKASDMTRAIAGALRDMQQLCETAVSSRL